MCDLIAPFIGIICVATAVIFIIWIEKANDKDRAKEMDEMRQQIKNLPTDTQVQIWTAYYRQQADNDR